MIEKSQKERNRGIVRDIITTTSGYREEMKVDFENMRAEEEMD